MPGFSQAEIDEYEEIGFQNEKESRLNYLNHGQPLSQRHKLYLQEKERQKRGGAGSLLNPNSEATPRQDTYRQQTGQTYDYANQMDPSPHQAPTNAYQTTQTTWDSQAYSAASLDEQPLPDDGPYSIYTPSTSYSQDVGYYGALPVQPNQSQPNRQTAVMKTMMQVHTSRSP
jgi:hypothetical protein